MNNYLMIQKFLKALNLSIFTKLGGIMGTPENEQQLFDELSKLIRMNYEANMDLNWLLENCPEAAVAYHEYREEKERT